MNALKILLILGLTTLPILTEETGGDTPAPAEGEANPDAASSGEGGEEAGDESGEKKEKMVGHCNKALLEAYDIEADWETVEDQNLLSPEIEMNCCSYRAQMDIFRKWVMKGEREAVLKTYR